MNILDTDKCIPRSISPTARTCGQINRHTRIGAGVKRKIVAFAAIQCVGARSTVEYVITFIT